MEETVVIQKAFWKSKTFWGAFLLVFVNIYEGWLVPTFGLPHLPQEFYVLMNAFGFTLNMYGRKTASTDIGLSTKTASRAELEAAKMRLQKRL